MDHPIRVSMQQGEKIGSACVYICRRGRGKFHFNVTPASIRRLGKLINGQAEARKFVVRPYITEIVGWVAETVQSDSH